MHKKQIAVLIVASAIMGYLYFQPVKGLVKPKAEGHATAAVPEAKPVTNVTVELASAASKLVIGSALAETINDLEAKLKNAADSKEQLSLQKQLAKAWDDVNQPAPAAFYYQQVGAKENKYKDWFAAGTHFNEAYSHTRDTTAQPAYVINAIASFKNAVKLQPANLDAKTGLGIAYVNQTSLGITDANGGSPMQGIMLLLDVVKQDPKNASANLSLGMFAMKSGQYEKAVARFKTIIAQKPAIEPYFYLAESYAQLGEKKEAIDAYQKCKEMMSDADVSQRNIIDGYIKDLKN